MVFVLCPGISIMKSPCAGFPSKLSISSLKFNDIASYCSNDALLFTIGRIVKELIFNFMSLFTLALGLCIIKQIFSLSISAI